MKLQKIISTNNGVEYVRMSWRQCGRRVYSIVQISLPKEHIFISLMKASFELIYGGLEFLVLTRETLTHLNHHPSRRYHLLKKSTKHNKNRTHHKRECWIFRSSLRKTSAPEIFVNSYWINPVVLTSHKLVNINK